MARNTVTRKCISSLERYSIHMCLYNSKSCQFRQKYLHQFHKLTALFFPLKHLLTLNCDRDLASLNPDSNPDSNPPHLFSNPNPDSGFLGLNPNPNLNPAQKALNPDSNPNPDSDSHNTGTYPSACATALDLY